MNIIVFGDSISWGAFDAKYGGWVERLKTHLFQYESFVYNCSISGNTSHDVLKRMKDEIPVRMDEGEELGIIIAIGANDCGFNSKGRFQTDILLFERRLFAIFKMAQSFTTKIMFVGLTPIINEKTNPVSWDSNLNYSDEKTAEYDAVIKNFCLTHGVSGIPFVDVRKIIFPEIDTSKDGCHLKSCGHEAIYNSVKPIVSTWINE